MWWFWCGDWVSGWWIDPHLVGRAFCCLTTHLPWIHVQGITHKPHPTWTRLWGLLYLDQAVANFECGPDIHSHKLSRSTFASRQQCKVWASQFPFFTILRILFLLVGHTIVLIWTCLWLWLNNNLPMTCPSLWPLWEMAKWDLKLVSV